MDRQIDVEALRAKLKAMPWAEAMRLADAAKVSRATTTHFRMGRIAELGGFKVQALRDALLQKERDEAKRVKAGA